MNTIDPSLPRPLGTAPAPGAGIGTAPPGPTTAPPPAPHILYRRPGIEPGAAVQDAGAPARRERLLQHTQRHSARREALAALLRSGALADAALVDPLLKRDVHKLMAFVFDEGTGQAAEPR